MPSGVNMGDTVIKTAHTHCPKALSTAKRLEVAPHAEGVVFVSAALKLLGHLLIHPLQLALGKLQGVVGDRGEQGQGVRQPVHGPVLLKHQHDLKHSASSVDGHQDASIVAQGSHDSIQQLWPSGLLQELLLATADTGADQQCSWWSA